jgi:hypothetical protein
MRFATAAVLLVAFTLPVAAQGKKDTPTPKTGFSALLAMLDLVTEQKVAIAKIQAKYKDKLEKLPADEQKKQLSTLQAEERNEITLLLTPGQKEKLRDLARKDSLKKDEK